MSTADDFLDAAQTLLDHGSHSGHWRRSVSTSYYALFHALTSAASLVVFSDAITQQAALRWFDHAAIRRVSKAIGDAPASDTDSKLVRWISEQGGKYGFETCPDPRLKTIGQSFVELHKQREQADYYRPGEIDFSEDSADRCPFRRSTMLSIDYGCYGITRLPPNGYRDAPRISRQTNAVNNSLSDRHGNLRSAAEGSKE